MKPTDLIKNHQQRIALVIGYCLVAGLFFGLGRISATSFVASEIRVEEAFVPLNYTAKPADNQSPAMSNPQAGPSPTPSPAPNPVPAAGLDCAGKIKGSSSKIYHKPGGSSYNRTKPIACFDTEDQAKAAGFRAAKN